VDEKIPQRAPAVLLRDDEIDRIVGQAQQHAGQSLTRIGGERRLARGQLREAHRGRRLRGANVPPPLDDDSRVDGVISHHVTDVDVVLVRIVGSAEQRSRLARIGEVGRYVNGFGQIDRAPGHREGRVEICHAQRLLELRRDAGIVVGRVVPGVADGSVENPGWAKDMCIRADNGFGPVLLERRIDWKSRGSGLAAVLDVHAEEQRIAITDFLIEAKTHLIQIHPSALLRDKIVGQRRAVRQGIKVGEVL